MDYIAALTPSVVMAIAFIALIVTIVKTQGGPNKSKEDAAVDAAFARAEANRRESAAGGGPAA
ncbi:hypothetical protein JGS22_011140 [Streptomyces sp. P38-E01]|uniref:Uncharacterized protein n=1 Tax=Streptomyces tardus TaxID=2780544 RepID=A0A949JFT5_9ACTN|nr:hypothetical protein [Streptomyces tardus]MBU7598153.1 hypothetical protein [Streptomyces tardus]